MAKPKVVIIVQARMTSTRLPGKVLLPILGKPLLSYEIERLRRVRLADEIVVATTVNHTDQPVVDLCQELGVPCYRGSEHDVLGRYYEAASLYSAEIIVRITADCPLIEPRLIDDAIVMYLAEPQAFDYVSNTHVRCYPHGLDNEVFSFAALKTAHYNATKDYEREHVTPYIHLNREQFRIGDVIEDVDYRDNRWTVDTPEDFELIQKIIEMLYPHKPEFSMIDVLNLLEKHPEWREINRHVHQKRLGE